MASSQLTIPRDVYFITPKGEEDFQRLDWVVYGECPTRVESAVDLDILDTLLEEGPLDYRDLTRIPWVWVIPMEGPDRYVRVSISTEDIRSGVRRLYEAGLIDKGED